MPDDRIAVVKAMFETNGLSGFVLERFRVVETVVAAAFVAVFLPDLVIGRLSHETKCGFCFP